ncbi:PREDICTED: transcription factor Adf-1-like isoform X2 [Rhagoletis zephyria]|uniref:transcription factor Adf-1-like isoform X2 n=1 Tax=Rhagoletis zephyria TaxID=28612 RepID=UPI00081182D0|nr:PREDICTED: transcription factor Adf-1-like isoform X2 [Rhagoletis zephyria]XP_036331047.1 transcription factor Adf-1-like isoform X2 [Rhagoletis pomonella]
MEKLDANLETQFDLNLIEAVKQNPVIYDRSHYNYKHFVRKAQTWKQIAELLGVPEQKCTKRWKSLRDKFAREMKLCQESRWRYFKQMQFLVDSIRQYRESLLGKCNNVQQNTNQVAQVDPNQQQQQQPQQQAVVDVFTQPFNGAATTSTQALAHTHEITVTGDTQIAASAAKDQKPYFYEPVLKRERTEEDNHDNMLNTIKIFQNSMTQAVSAEDQSFGMVVTDMLNTLGVRQKAEAKVHIIKYLTDMQLLAQHNKY